MALSGAALQEKYRHQAEMLANKASKQYRHLKKRFARQNIDIFRIYDWDIPEIRAVVDWYAGHLVVGEYTRTQSTAEWLPMMGEAVAKALEVPPAKVHLKERRTGTQADTQGKKRYERLARTERKIVMSERDLKFYVNLDDYVDTGLFADHRDTRQKVRDMAQDMDFLNLFCYSGTFTCYAAKGGARASLSVDRSRSAIRWTRENLALNNIAERGHTLIQAHVFDFLEKAAAGNRRFDLAVVDPPSFATSRDGAHNMDIVKDHPRLLEMTVALMKSGATIFFSTNHQEFTPRVDGLKATDIREITSATIPEDYRNRKKPIHRCWRITV